MLAKGIESPLNALANGGGLSRRQILRAEAGGAGGGEEKEKSHSDRPWIHLHVLSSDLVLR
jgi:hypothetical protein